MVPIYRAKKIDSNEYVIGYIVKSECDEDFLIRVDGEYHFIDISTLSIHFPDMIDCKGDKIFASLQKDGYGGDIIEEGEYEFVLSFDGRKYDLRFKNDNIYALFNEWDDWNQFTKTGIL